MANYDPSEGDGTKETTATSPGDDVRGRLISRRGASIYDVFQQLHGPGYSKVEIDHALRIPAVRNSPHEELRRQNAERQDELRQEKAAQRPTSPTPPPYTILGGPCFYHRAFGGVAKKCRPPCSFKPCQQ